MWRVYLRRIKGKAQSVGSTVKKVGSPLGNFLFQTLPETFNIGLKFFKEDLQFSRRFIYHFQKRDKNKVVPKLLSAASGLSAISFLGYIAYKRYKTKQDVFLDYSTVLLGGERLDLKINTNCKNLDISMRSHSPILLFPWLLPANPVSYLPRSFSPNSPEIQYLSSSKHRIQQIGVISDDDIKGILFDLEFLRTELGNHMDMLKVNSFKGDAITRFNETWKWDLESRQNLLKTWSSKKQIEDEVLKGNIDGITFFNHQREPTTIRVMIGCTGERCDTTVEAARRNYLRYLFEL